jgi:hypothetical protein
LGINTKSITKPQLARLQKEIAKLSSHNYGCYSATEIAKEIGSTQPTVSLAATQHGIIPAYGRFFSKDQVVELKAIFAERKKYVSANSICNKWQVSRIQLEWWRNKGYLPDPGSRGYTAEDAAKVNDFFAIKSKSANFHPGLRGLGATEAELQWARLHKDLVKLPKPSLALGERKATYYFVKDLEKVLKQIRKLRGE